MKTRTCRLCGCTDQDCSGCIARTGEACYWVEADLCSACADNPQLMDDLIEEDDDQIECWCGAKGTYSELFDESGLTGNGTCGGMGIIDCRCGGDLCVCHHHGEIECPGCMDCENDDDDFYDDEL